MTLSTSFELSGRTITGGSEDDLRHLHDTNDSNNTSSESIPRRNTTASSQSPGTLQKYQKFGRDRLRSVSPNSRLLTNESDKPVPSRSQSMEGLSLPPLHETTTGDSGTGDSITHIPVETLAQASPCDSVSVFGFDKMVVVTDRFVIDEAKVTDYKNRRRGFLPVASSDKPQLFNSEIKPDTNRQDSRNPKKSQTILSRLINTFSKAPPSVQPLYLPVIRHHPSRTSNDGNQ
jgi:hypothetical protein